MRLFLLTALACSPAVGFFSFWDSFGLEKLLANVDVVISNAAPIGSGNDLRNKLVRPLLKEAVGWAQEFKAASKHKDVKKDGASEYPYLNVIPQYQVSALASDTEDKVFEGTCFKEIRTTATFNDDGTVKLEVEALKPNSLTCEDNLLFLSTGGWVYKRIYFHGKHEITFSLHDNANQAEKDDLQTKGVRVCMIMTSMVTWTENLAETLLLFEGEIFDHIIEGAQKRNIAFLESYTHFKFPEKDPATNFNITKSDVRSGDFFGILRLDGLDPVLAFAMGSTTGHTTVAIWEDDELYVAESTVTDAYWPDNGIQIHKFDEWLALCRKAEFHMVHAPLSDEASRRFNATAAMAFFREQQGFDYGYYNLLFGWLDTQSTNYPCLPPDYKSNCLRWELVETMLAHLDHRVPSVTDQLLNQALLNRLDLPTDAGLRTSEIWAEADKQQIGGVGAQALPAMAEKDSFFYNTTRNGQPAVGKSMVCCVFVCHMWKEGGLFDDLKGGRNSVNCNEQTNLDDYSLNIFKENYQQVLGDHTLTLNHYSTVAPYPHMHEVCATEAPDYPQDPTC